MHPGTDTRAGRPQADDVHAQYARILAYLRCNGRTGCAALALACDVPSVTKRVSELRALGWCITATQGRIRTRAGGWRRATFYELTGAHAQGDLFEGAAA